MDSSPVGPGLRRPLADFLATETPDPLAGAFPPKTAVHPFVGMVPVPAEAMADCWARMSETPRSGPSVAYVHVPFCENHCLFCGFYQNAWRPEAGAPYVDRVIEQLRLGADTGAQKGHPLRAVYLGGGTPSALSAEDLSRLIQALREHLPLAPDCEFTVEGRIVSFGREKAQAVFDAGANRISLGVQSFDDRLRRSMGRKVSGAQARNFLAELIAMDRGAVVIDLIYGLPGQTPEIWRKDLQMATDLGLDGVDLYSLNLIPGTPLLSSMEKGKLGPIPQSQLGRFYAAGDAHMAEAGWEAISCTHWRSGTRERNVYNLEVKAGAACLAFGAGAGGNLAGYSYRNLPTPAAFDAAIQSGRPPLAGIMRAPALQPLVNAIKSGMERGRLDLPFVERVCNAMGQRDFAALAAPLTRQWTSAGLMEADGSRLKLTLPGRFWQVHMTQRLIDWTRQEWTRSSPEATRWSR